MDYHIIKISRNKKQYLDLLLLGDEQETMIDRYLERGDYGKWQISPQLLANAHCARHVPHRRCVACGGSSDDTL